MLVDDHSILRSGLKMLLNYQEDLRVVGEASSGEEALLLLENKMEPDVILLDLSMPGIGGLATLEQITKKYTDIKVLILTMHDDEKYLPKVLENGACGYVVKKAVDNVVITAIRTVAAGQFFFDSTMNEALIASISPSKKKKEKLSVEKPLSVREKEVLRLIALGFTNKQIGAELSISIKTVETHKSNIRDKLNTNKRSDLVRHALKENLI